MLVRPDTKAKIVVLILLPIIIVEILIHLFGGVTILLDEGSESEVVIVD